MDIRPLTDTFAVSPQITSADVAEIAAAGYRTVICNRPDDEVPPFVRAAEIRQAVEDAGLTFVDIPIVSRNISRSDIRRQREAILASDGPVLAYCASGTRSTITWMFGALESSTPEELIERAVKAGYPLGDLLPQLQTAAKSF
ncbi:TIGR01244 family sulfur transferase [Tropicimonas isoalkanivorans]|uniref:TIGR01244 family protein n=1 Tax=Tropicimonas isoalkanivorans TaxID=441112 RepID=A0A1I1GDJ9_9RHOB|nr:TIGR01244 family sulfur transferase [Tropicimonas isoalkanivorans]SFC09867.1 TIGR01244 family protein [Tropicimonas isoalkanivorans]